MILIVTTEANEHVRKVQQYLKHEAVLMDIAWFPKSIGLSIQFCDTCESISLCMPDGKRIQLADIGAVWYRRISPIGLHQELTDETARLFAWSESNEALQGLWYSLNCFWMNPPVADEVAQRKIRQLQLASSLGLCIPDTMITNEPDTARGFIDVHGFGNVVRKAFRNIAQAPRETKLVQSEDMALISSVAYAPVIFQRYIPARLDLRVTIVEDDIFAAAVESEPEYRADYRLGLNSAKVFPYQLPEEIASKLTKMMKSLGIKYGAFDLRVTPEGEHVFLEVNPGGEFLFISERTGQQIPQAIAAALERHR